MSRTELIEWIAMLLIIVLWWPVVFTGWSPAAYRYPLYVVSFGVLLWVFVNRLRRVNEGFQTSEQMMQAKHQAEEMARGGKPSLDEKAPPPISDPETFAPGAPPTDSNSKQNGSKH